MNKTDSSGSSASTGSEMSRDHLEELSESLAQRWKNVARKLGVKENKIESIAQSHPRNQVEASMEMLKEWKSKIGKKNATYAKMAEALENAGRKDLAEMVEDWKPRQDSASEEIFHHDEGSKKACYRDPGDDALFPRYEMRNMRGTHRGKCLLLTYEKFSEPELAERKGNKTDIDNLTKIFEKLNFDVESKRNLDSKATESWINSMAKMDHHDYDCFVLFVCSHGDKDSFFTSDGKKIVIQDVLTPFKVENCRTLANKPKIFFFNSCRGRDEQELVKYDGPGDRGPGNVESYRPNEADFCVVLSTVPGYVAIRNEKFGTYYVQSLYKCVETEKCYLKYHLIDILTLVNKDLNETFTGRPNKTRCQVSTIISTLDKAVYFSSP